MPLDLHGLVDVELVHDVRLLHLVNAGVEELGAVVHLLSYEGRNPVIFVQNRQRKII